jgi:hypothetical protein
MYVDIVNLIRDTANAVNPNGTFFFGRVSDATLSLGDKPFPQIHLYPFSVAPPDQRFSLDITDNIRLVFYLQDSPNTSDTDREIIINDADILQRAFRAELDQTSAEYSKYLATPFFKEHNGITSGMVVTFALKNKSNPCD